MVSSDKRMESLAPVEDQSVSFERKIIKEGSIRFETTSVIETQKEIRKIVAELGGYIGNENSNNYEGIIEYSLTARVPEDKFNTLIDKVSSLAEKVESKNINSSDVTEEFIDVEARIKTKKELEARYKEILKKANRVDEILNIEREMGNLRAEIESLEGRMNYLKNRISLSTLNITFYEKVSAPFGFFSKVKQALHNGWQALLWFIIILISLWPFILLILIVLFIILKFRKKKTIPLN
jgi:chromosome segregation ATPase